ncbi:hypothetical protein Oter_1100 [Opitutus terrae PB90-1]|uniref:Uncharacterized protein n=1 Tax=Opitutus terrae (strain DSM 11246 / JCM 15787 / PB90-1) TaxID=452637 RepID=B1ZNF4_OPITP|nr:hypothetical protein Oter_1100 [Opitutus terrae PB90-1]
MRWFGEPDPLEVSTPTRLLIVTTSSIPLVNDPILQQFAERIAVLEARLAALEQPASTGRIRIAAPSSAPVPARMELDELTWVMIAAAVAAAYPKGRIHAISAVVPVETEPVWGIEGRRDIFHSHRVR